MKFGEHVFSHLETKHVVPISGVREKLVDGERSCGCEIEFDGGVLNKRNAFNINARG